MITFIGKTSRVSKTTDIGKQVEIHIANETVEKMAKELTKEWKNRSCEKHPEQDSTIALKVDANGGMRADFTGVCCKEFRSKFKIDL